MLTVDIAYDVSSRLLSITHISTDQDNVLIGTTGDDMSTMIRCTFRGSITDYDTIWAEFDVRVPDAAKRHYNYPAVQFSDQHTLLIPAYILSNTIRGDLPMQIALENSQTGIRTVSINKLLFRVAEAIDADHSPYNVLTPSPETFTGNFFHTLVGDGVNTTYTIVHNLGTPFVDLFCYANTDFKPDIQVSWERVSDNEVSVTFTEPPAVDGYTVCMFIPGSSDVISVNGYSGDITQAELGLITQWQTTPDDTHFPSEKLVKDTFPRRVVESVTYGTGASTITLAHELGQEPEAVMVYEYNTQAQRYDQIYAPVSADNSNIYINFNIPPAYGTKLKIKALI